MSAAEVEEAREPVTLHRKDGVVTIVLDQPRRKNAMTMEAWRLLGEHLSTVTLGEDRVVVITGAGEDFCAGADLSGDSRDTHPVADMQVVNAACLALHRSPVPTVARVDGVAVGAGMNLALACDLVVASDRARFSEIFIKRGLSVDFGGAWALPRLVGLQKAKEMVLLGDIISAEEARRVGLVTRVVDPVELDEVVDGLVARLKANPPIAASLSKRMLNASFEMDLVQALDAEGHNQSVNMVMDDAREAFEAFRTKREPVFRGR
ncbi:enoyl-CoA hydratase/isomerase family protein [Nocardioides campestrisoli]|uniref:enoyl-CoA hydratase/isomerase family protein n=1 Tax=Nocardioides campestrisoli TaxID=2736757 RepID=UPI00163D4521|nr:enoyl-CoA hydratase-related protein [Nocardioides campestrisoli]